MEASDKLKRVVEARMKLKARFEEKIKGTPSVADDKPLGTETPTGMVCRQCPLGRSLLKSGRCWIWVSSRILPSMNGG
ncbi:hypothetical protein [Paraflavitalea speifideaquila]|uniref:hypothetical protein n=1 Tax=Paraflavitalea speifideaquila TaxID=3076558 RepID=UPI0028E980A5|nr:hypothetical protein [Paraflavitalea speifideiaquila]